MTDDPGQRRQPIQRHGRAVGGWIAGVAAGVISALVVAWVLAPDPPPPTDGPPVTVATNIVHNAVNGEGWISDRPLAQVPPRPGYNESWSEWADRAGAVPHRTLQVYFTVQGRSGAQVTLTGLTVLVVQRRPALTGTLFQQQGGDPGAFRSIQADLDQDPPTLESFFSDALIFSNEPSVEHKPIVFPYEVSIADAESFLVDGRAQNCDCEWVVDLAWATEGRTGTTRIDDNGRPFRVSGDANVTTLCAMKIGGPSDIEEDCQPA